MQAFSDNIICVTPKECFEFHENSIKVIPGHPEFFDAVDKNSIIRKMDEYSYEEKREKVKLANEALNKYKIKWKRQDIPMNVYEEEQILDLTLSGEVVQGYSDIINKKGGEFIKKLNYERAKNRNKERVFRAI